MYVIGISSGIKHGHHDGAAVLLRDGELIAAAEEERFTLAKHARGELPRGAIGFCLKQAGITMRDVDWICSPLKTYTNYTQRLTEYFKYQFGHSPKIELYDHHLCHAASSFYGSGFSEATVACFDFSGDSSSGLVAHARGNDFRVLTRFGRNNSLGLYYGMLTQYLGYQMTNDEYKVMGLSSYGSPDYLDKFAKLLRPAGINYELDPGLDKRRRDAEIFTSDFSTRQERIFTEKMEEILGPRRLRGAPLDQRLTNIAASGQKQLEIVATEVIRSAIAETGCGDVCIAGGVGLNCKMNMEIAAEPSVKRLYVPPVPHDAGVALGAAMMKCTEAGHTIAPLTHAYWGPEYSNDTIKETLDKIGARFELLDDPVSRCVTDLTEQKTVGWFQGRMEYGPRALGNRSILADPRHAGMKDRINLTIKYREEFRPFCPSVLYDRQAEYFEDTFDAPFMVVTFPVNEKVAETMPAVVHVDNTARIQSVHADSNPLYSRLIGEFAKATSLPVLINTSLNINEQPTVNAPLEALHTYFCSGLDVLYLGPYRLSKPR
ncbi:carbamoyl transferase [Bradyrhizobium japonicum]|uniref:carbamoyltransferase family protein n=1 Tax=Bradyrhizobium japonicum TaxID=375 RepID=UPI001BA74D1E|nr:carbamoyltransferase C-terminal domain-containing protein [Bradyrhizobium japonicum]MBR0806173.1 carbamoyl transferase [Bradyrhizobium japonicum]